MNFGEAIGQMKRGRLLRRAGWNGQNMHVYLEDSHAYPSKAYPIKAGAFKGETRHYEAHFVLYTAQGTHQPGWLASQADMLADDWEVCAQ